MILLIYLLIGLITLFLIYRIAKAEDQSIMEFALKDAINSELYETYKNDEIAVTIILEITYVAIWPLIIYAVLHLFLKDLRH